MISTWFKQPLWQRVAVAFIAGIGAGLLLGPHSTYWLKPFGDLYLNLMRLIVVPLIFFTVASSVARLSDTAKMMQLGIRTLLWFLLTSALAIMVGLVVASIVKPGAGLVGLPLGNVTPRTIPSLLDVIFGIVPPNAVKALAETNVLQVLFVSALFGATLVSLKDQTASVRDLLAQGELIVFRATRWILQLTPIGTFGLIAWVVGNNGLSSLVPLGKFIGAMYGACLIHLFIVYGSLLRIHSLKPWHFFRAVFPAQQMAFVTSSSMATLPSSMNVAVNRLGVPADFASFAIPLGANVKMDGCGAIYPTIAALFIAQYFGLELSLMQYLLISLTALLGSLATAGVPGTSIVILTMTLSAGGLPLEGIGYLIAIDRIVDMIRTTTNVTGQILVPVLVAKRCGILDEAMYYDESKPRDKTELASAS